MTFLHPLILAGLALVVLPVVIHLLMKQKPKRTPFPALRLLQQSQAKVSRRLNLQHWLLMLLRMLVIGAIVFAIARPTLPAANYQLTSGEWLRLLTIILVGGGIYTAFEIYLYRRRQQLPNVDRFSNNFTSGGPTAAAIQQQASKLRSRLIPLVCIAAGFAVVLFLIWPYQTRIMADWSKPSSRANLELPVAAVFIFDTSPSMQYRNQGKTRLEVAQSMATTQWGKLPAGSRLALIDGMQPAKPTFLADRNTAHQRIQQFTTRYEERPLEDSIRLALSLQENDRTKLLEAEGGATDRFVREVYLFTDLARHQWHGAADAGLLSELEKLKDVSIYIIDVGELKPSNNRLYGLKLSQETIAENGEVLIEATVESDLALAPKPIESSAPPAQNTTDPGNAATLNTNDDISIELVLGDPRVGNTKRVGLETVSRGGRQTVQFTASNLPSGPSSGYLRLIGDDPLAFDNSLPIAMTTAKPPKVLVVSANRADSRLLMEALAPAELTRVGKATTVPTWIPASSLAATDLKSYDVVFLINLPRPTAEDWKLLRGFVEAGGGLVLTNGHPSKGVVNSPTSIDPLTYENPDALAILPARLKASLSFRPGQVWEFPNRSHGFMAPLAEFGVLEEWESQVVNRYWTVNPVDDAIVLARFLDERKSPALLERRVGKGIVQQWTTSWSLPDWNDLPRSWAFVALADASVDYLSQRQARRFNFVLGDPIQLIFPSDQVLPPQWLVRTPDERQQALDSESSTRLIIPATIANQPGIYLVQPKADPAAMIPLGVRVRDAESNLERMSKENIEQVFGTDRVLVHRELETLERAVLSGRIGQEVYALVLLLLVIGFVTEHLLANWFYAPPAAALTRNTIHTAPRPEGAVHAN